MSILKKPLSSVRRKTSVFVWLSLSITVFSLLIPKSAFAESNTLASTRISYWSQAGQNLDRETQEISLLDRGTLVQFLKQDRILFIDTREIDEYSKSHIPNARNIPFSQRESLLRHESFPQDKILVPYCNWDFRGYIAALDLKRNGFSNIAVMYPHGLRGWIASGFPVAGESVGVRDDRAYAELLTKIQEFSVPETGATGIDSSAAPQTRRISMRILPKKIEPSHIEASVGDQIILDLASEGEDHWFVIPDFDVNLRLERGEHKTVSFVTDHSGYFPFGCINCCTKYRCQTKQAILVDLKESVTAYGE